MLFRLIRECANQSAITIHMVRTEYNADMFLKMTKQELFES